MSYLNTIGKVVTLTGISTFFAAFSAEAVMCTTTAAGNWSNAAIWSCGHEPASGDSVTINHDVVVNTQTNPVPYVFVAAPATVDFSNGQKINMLTANSYFVIAAGAHVNGGNGGSKVVYPAPGTTISGPFAIDGPAYTNGNGMQLNSSPLPIALISFTAMARHAQAILDWAVAREVNHAYYVVSRSTDGKTFMDVAKIAPKLNATTNSYQYIDEALLPATQFYRLAMVATNGETTFSPVISLHANSVTKRPVRLYPNPAANSLRCVVEDVAGVANISIIDLTGRVLLQAVNARQEGEVYEFDVSKLPGGLYQLVVYRVAGKSNTVLFHKQ